MVEEVVHGLDLDNVTFTHGRAENVNEEYDFIVSRAVARMDAFERWVRGKVLTESRHSLANGILYLKGGDLSEELAPFPQATIYPLSTYFEEDFFETKSVVHLPMK